MFHAASWKWMARAMIRGKRPCLGYFNDEEEAGRAYDRAVYAAEPGAFANFPIEEYPDLAAERDRRQAEQDARYARLGGSAMRNAAIPSAQAGSGPAAHLVIGWTVRKLRRAMYSALTIGGHVPP